MDSERWQHLPQELLFRLLARLPWWSNLHLRLVCTTWRTLLASPEFLKESSPQLSMNDSVSERPPCWICRSRDMSYTLKNWTRSQSLPLSSKLLWPSNSKVIEPDLHFRLEAATSGLLLMAHLSHIHGRLSFLVNPLNGSKREVPSLPVITDPSTSYNLGMVEDKKSQSHKITVVHTELKNCPGGCPQEEIYVYDSRTNRWDLVHCMQRQHDDYRGLRDAVFVNGELYILTVMQSDEGWIYRVFLVLPTRWDEVPAKITVKMLSNVRMFEQGGCLMLVAETKDKDVVSNSNSNTCASVRIWKLDESMSQWEEAFVMPEVLLMQLYVPRRGIRFKVYIEGHYACFSGCVMVVCDMARGEWTSTNGGSFDSVDDSEFLFEPRLDIFL